MPAQYLLPCPECKQPRPVDASQCGLTVDCNCGTKLHVPTMRGLAKLPKAAFAEPVRRPTWGAREGMILVGAIVAVAGLGLGLIGYLQPDVTPDEFLERKIGPRTELADLTPAELLEAWAVTLQSGLGQYNPEPSAILETENHLKHIWTWVALCIGGLGVLMIPAAFVLFGPPR